MIIRYRYSERKKYLLFFAASQSSSNCGDGTAKIIPSDVRPPLTQLDLTIKRLSQKAYEYEFPYERQNIEW